MTIPSTCTWFYDATRHFRCQLKMPPKRASPPENSSRQSKKQKITAARSIAVQGVPSGSSKSNDANGQWVPYSNHWGGAEFVTPIE